MIAGKLLKAIDTALRKDDGASFRRELRPAIAACEDAYDNKPDSVRSHLGASQLGNKCHRATWYSFRWVIAVKKDDPRMMRIWNRGHLEEGRFVALLRQIPGVTVWTHTAEGKQFRVNIYGEHASGSCDGASLGIPDMPTVALLNEYKTHKASSFKKLQTEGVKLAKPEHHIQMMQYMPRLSLSWGLYMAVNKDTDHIHAELLEYDAECNRIYTQLAIAIVTTHNPPPRISNNPTWFECKFCDFAAICHSGAPVAKTCRSCRFAEIRENGWYCGGGTYQGPVSKERQLAGCARHEFLVALTHHA